MNVKRPYVLLIAAGAVAVALVASAGIAMAAGGDTDTPITGPALEQASQGALDHLGEGRVTDTEIGDEESLYEVEVTLDDGSEVDVQLDENFDVVGTEADGSSGEDND